MTLYIAPYRPYRMPRRWMRMPEQEMDFDFTLAVDAREEEDAYTLQALVPGLKAEDVNIQILEDSVTISGAFKDIEQEYLLRELPHGSFRRTLRLPVAVEADKVEARISDGVLTLRLPKAEASRPKTIKVNVK